MRKLPMWQSNWDQSEKQWDERSKIAAKEHPLKGLTSLPKMPGITEETAKGLKWKSLRWMIQKDHEKKILKGFLQHPLKYGWSFVTSVLQKKSYVREKDFFLYNVSSLTAFEELLKNPEALLILGFSYCHKPFECPSGRFTPDCQKDLKNSVCQQCFIGKAFDAITSVNTIPLIIPTIHYIGEKVFEIVHKYRGIPILFMITACEMTLEMFGDWGNMVNIQGTGIRLDGRICNTMKAFELSEQGIKPGLTVVLDETQKRILQLIRTRNEALNKK